MCFGHEQNKPTHHLVIVDIRCSCKTQWYTILDTSVKLSCQMCVFLLSLFVCISFSPPFFPLLAALLCCLSICIHNWLSIYPTTVSISLISSFPIFHRLPFLPLSHILLKEIKNRPQMAALDFYHLLFFTQRVQED